MAKAVSIEVKVDQFNAAMEQLSAAVGNAVPMKRIIDAEVTAILTATIKKTKKATTASIVRSHERRPPWRTYNGKKYNLTYKYPDRVWSMIQEREAASLAKKLAAKALAAQVWYLLGVKVGNVQASGDVIKARKDGLNNAINGKVTRFIENGKYGLSILNSSPLIRFSDSRQAIFGAIAGRIGFFKKNLEKGVFNSMATILKKYPGFQTQSNG